MTPQELKNSILQLAIQGKLVEQRSEEGTAEELLKKALRFNNKIRACFSDEEKTIDLPESWTWVKLSELTNDSTLNDGNWVLSKDMVSNGPVKLIQLGSIGNCHYIDKGFKYLTEEHFHELHGKQIHEGYLLVNRLIGDRMFCCILPSIDGILMTAVDVCWIAPNEELLNQKYLMYALSSGDFQEKVKELGRGTTRFRISKLNLINIAFPLPPLAEQKRIVAKIEELLPLIDRYEKAWSRLEEFNKRFPDDMQKSILQMAIQGKLVEQRPEEGTGEELYQKIQAEKQKLIKEGKIKKEKLLPEITEDEKLFDIPDNWKWVRFEEVMLTLSTGPFGSMLHKSDYIGNGIPLVNPANIVNGSIVPSDKMMVSKETRTRLAAYVLHEGMIVLGRRGEMGRSAIVSVNEDGWLCGTGSFFILPSKELFNKYVNLLFRTPYVRNCLIGESVGTTMNNLNHTILKKMPIPLPPHEEQKRIVATIEELLPLCQRLSTAE